MLSIGKCMRYSAKCIEFTDKTDERLKIPDKRQANMEHLFRCGNTI